MNSNFYDELKFKNDILEVAMSLGYNGKRSGSCFQGNCPRHGSTGGSCFVIWPKIQAWKCFHCGKKGDVINLVMFFKNCDHKTAVKLLADRAGIPFWGGKELSTEEIAQKEAEMEEKMLVERMLTEVADWYHGQLKNYPQIKDYLLNHYGFSEEIIEQLQIGFAPVSKKSDHTSELADYLNSIPEFRGKIVLTGLFSFKFPFGPLYDSFKGRIIFPYWLNGKVVYLAARSSSLTPEDPYECYTDKDGKVRINEEGKAEFIKYKKLRSHDATDEKREHFSKFIQNDIFLGEDTIRSADDIVIAEGVPDWVSAVDHGFAAISPATVSFRENDLEKLEELTRNAKSIYIINDNEENNAGFAGAIKTGKHLTEKGKNVFLVKLPRPEGLKKIDLNEYLKDHSADELRELMKNAKSVLEILIGNLPENFLKAQPHIKEDIAPLMTDMEDGTLQYYISNLAKKVKATAKIISAEIENAKKLKKEKEFKAAEVPVNPEIEKAALALTLDPLVFRKRIDVINDAGVVGERRIIAMYQCAIDSRLLPENFLNPNSLAVKNAGHFGSGKSYTLTLCTQIYPEDAYYLITNGSAKSLYYLKGGLKNKALIVTEGFQFQENNAADSEMVYVIRSLISEGRIVYNTVEKDEDGKLLTVEKKLEGPTSFITTTIMENLEPQLEDRLFTIHPDEGIDQTKKIISMTANQKAGTFEGVDQKIIDVWKFYHRMLKPVEVIIPFANLISDFINKNTIIPLSTRRAFKRVLIVIQSVACAYQFQRAKDDSGKVIAETADYWMALQIVTESFRENMGALDEKTEERIDFIEEKGMVLPKDMAGKFAVSAASISQWTAKNAKKGILTWCNEHGNLFADDKELKKAKHSGKAYLRISDDYTKKEVTGLPSPFDLTGDPDWDENGKLLQVYDLKLKKSAEDVFNGVQPVFRGLLNTSDNDEMVNNIEKSDDEESGVKVFSEISGDSENNFIEDENRDDDIYEKNNNNPSPELAIILQHIKKETKQSLLNTIV